jgi:hypothetical protein
VKTDDLEYYPDDASKLLLIQGSPAAAGQLGSYDLTQWAAVELMWLRYTFTTSVAPGNRFPVIRITHSVNADVQFWSSISVPATLGNDVNWVRDGDTYAIGTGIQQARLGRIIVPSPGVLRWGAATLDAADSVQGATGLLRVWAREQN